MPIRDNYIPVLKSITRSHGQRPATAQIGPQESLQETIWYTREYVVNNTTEHFRYDYYWNALSRALTRLRFDPGDRRIVHLDIACGAGVFSWVVYDHMAAPDTPNPDYVDYYGYDHCAAMIELAGLFLERFPDRYEFKGFSDLEEISTTLEEEDFSNCDVVVTFGYALLQVLDDPAALGNFASIISGVFPSRSCIMVAADAHNDHATRAAFRGQCDALENALNDAGIVLDNRQATQMGSVMYARLTME